MILQLAVTLFVIIGTSVCQLSTQSYPASTDSSRYSDCCDLKLMDSNLQVAIESRRILPVGRFSLIKARLCTTDTIFIQIWKKINESAFEFKWQTEFNASITDIINAYTVIRFDDNPVTITSNDRIGVYNPSRSNLKFSIPYEFDQPETSSIYLSYQRFDNLFTFTNGLIIEVDDLRWPRTFEPYLSFCSSISDCPLLSSTYSIHEEPATYNPYSGYIPAYCCNNMISCDIGETVKDNLANQNNEMQYLKDTVDVLQNTLENLFNSQYVTGICPDGFAPGVYGVGSCYIIHRELIQMGQAVIRCRDLYSARLLNIQSEQEDKFIKTFVLNSTLTNIERFWTSGMYNRELRNWFWYDDDLVTKMPFGSYRNWKDGQELAAESIYDVCSVFTVNKTNNADYWEKATCTDLNFFICEFPKACF